MRLTAEDIATLKRTGFVLRDLDGPTVYQYTNLLPTDADQAEHRIWELIQLGAQHLDAALDELPAPLYAWAAQLVASLYSRYLGYTRALSEAVLAILVSDWDIQSPHDFREISLYVNTKAQEELRPVVFAALSGKDVLPLVWKLLEPSRRDGEGI